ncbi:MAG TPA: hypothetical protein VF765_10115 [Polyangiaceae bacterium]
MQTATVDIRRLQILNDSINRTIDALNQVRLSVYGTVTPNALGVTQAVGGLAHAAAQNPFVTNALANQFANPFSNPFASNAFASNVTSALNNPFATFANTGLGHSAFGSYADPYANARIAQTFPFLAWGYSPFAWPTI